MPENENSKELGTIIKNTIRLISASIKNSEDGKDMSLKDVYSSCAMYRCSVHRQRSPKYRAPSNHRFGQKHTIGQQLDDSDEIRESFHS